MLSKQKHSILLSEKNNRFYITHEKEAATPKFAPERLFWKFHEWQSPFFR